MGDSRGFFAASLYPLPIKDLLQKHLKQTSDETRSNLLAFT